MQVVNEKVRQLRELDIPGRFSSISYKGDNFCDLRHVCVPTSSSYSKRKQFDLFEGLQSVSAVRYGENLSGVQLCH